MGWGTLLIFFGKQTVIENITLFPDKKPFSPISSCSLHLGRNIRLAQGEIPSKFPHIFYWGEGGGGGGAPALSQLTVLTGCFAL